MNLSKIRNTSISLIYLLLGGVTASAEQTYHCAHCMQMLQDSTLAADPDSTGGGRQYAPDRKIDMLHLKLDVTPDFALERIHATATIDFQPIATPLVQLTLNAVDLAVSELTSDQAIHAYQVTNESIIITFEHPLPPNQAAQIVIHYDAHPESGMFFRTPKGGYPEGDMQLWTQGEPQSHRHWFPSHDYPNEKFTSEILCHVPKGMIALSNGKLLNESTDEGSGLTTFHWLQDKVHVNYLISLVAGKFAKQEDRHGNLPLAFYAPPSEEAQIASSFRDTRKILAFFEKEIGVPYPWDKYYNVCVLDYMFGGMENTSITTLTANTLFTDAHENLRSSRGLDAHEAAHQWFGDLVTCKDWSHLWLNEGFATYYSLLYDREAEGTDVFKLGLLENAEGIFRNKEDVTPIVHKGYNDPMDQFSFRAYPKGGWVLHMLRNQLGEDLYRECIKTYLERHRFQNVVTADLLRVVEELSGKSMDAFFDQWVFLSGYPELNLRYQWDDLTKQAKISVSQIHQTNDKRPLFRFPLPLRFKANGATHNETVSIGQQSEDFYFTLPQAPEIVRVDPEVTVLAKVNFEPDAKLLMNQLTDADDALGRLLAARAFGEKKGKQAVDALSKVLNSDPFYAVRKEAAEALSKINTPEALAVLTKSLSQEDARARQAVVRALTNFYGDEAYAALKQVLATEKNPDIVAIAIRGLGNYSKDALRDELLAALQSDSYHHATASAAIDAMSAQQDVFYVEPLLSSLKTDAAKFTTNGFSRALRALGTLAQPLEDKEPVRLFLTDQLAHPKAAVAQAAMGALGELRDPKSIPMLQTFVAADSESAKGKAAQAAITALRKETPYAAPREVGELRTQLSDLQRELKSVRDEMNLLRAQFKESMENKPVTEEPDSGAKQ